jgi:exonuclease III
VYQVYGTKRKINHLLYMDDLKLIGRSEEELINEIKIVKTFSHDIKMKFVLEKCLRISLKNGPVYRKEHIGKTMEYQIKELEPMKVYKYLGVAENHNIEHKNEKEKFKMEYVRRLRLILSTELSAKNKMQATGSLAVPVLRYSFGIINWDQEKIQKLDRKTRKMLTIHGQHHPRADIDHLVVPRRREEED